MSVLTFVIVGQQDHPIYEVDLTGPKEVGGYIFDTTPTSHTLHTLLKKCSNTFTSGVTSTTHTLPKVFQHIYIW